MTNLINMPNLYELGICICPECYHVYGSMSHKQSDKKKLECPECGVMKSIFISENIMRKFLEFMDD